MMPASVAWLASMLSLKSLSRPCARRKLITAAIEVILMLGGFHGLGLDVEGAGEPILSA